MVKYLALLSLLVALASCHNRANNKGINDLDVLKDTLSQGTKVQVGEAYIGMSITELRKAYPHNKFIREPLYMYGWDSDDDGFLMIDHNEQEMFFVWVRENDSTIGAIVILSPSIFVDGNVHVGMTIEDFLKKYPEQTLALDMMDDSREFCYVAEKDYFVEFSTTDSTRVAEYDYSAPEPEFIKVIRPEARISSIAFH